MLNLNHASLCGRLTADPELKQTKNGKPVCQITLAIDRPKDKEGNVVADFVRVTAYDKAADLIAKYCGKGDSLYVEASVRTGKYEKDGKTVYTTDFIVNRLQFAGKAKSATAESPETEPPLEPAEDNGGDDLPF